MTIFYLTRHGETEWNIQKRMQGWKNSALTEKGEEQAISLEERLIKTKFDAVYSSSSDRAYKTALLICKGRNIKIIKEPNLREINIGTWSGKTFREIQELDSKMFGYFWSKPDKYIPSNGKGETFQDVRKRVIPLIRGLKEKYPDKTLLIVSHGVVLKIILSFFERRPLRKLWNPPQMHACSLSIVNWDNNGVKIVLYGDISHHKNEK
ncbi:MAG: histidine phosphatase family protein [Promethearchaeota archaeon]